jgi:heme exporter protein C
VESLHPGGKGVEGNPGLSGSDLDPRLRIVFWPAVIGWTLLGVWISTLKVRALLFEEKQLELADKKSASKQKPEYAPAK